VTERQERCRKQVERENDVQLQTDGSAREPSGFHHLQFDYTARLPIHAKRRGRQPSLGRPASSYTFACSPSATSSPPEPRHS
jgi:hypothetical protein